MSLFSFQNALSKVQPKISNFLVPSTPFSNISPSKQLKVTSYFKKADSRSSQEENICSNSVQPGVSSPDCIPASPDQNKKRKRNDEPYKRKLLKLDSYNKLLYDESKNDDCHLRHSSGNQIKEPARAIAIPGTLYPNNGSKTQLKQVENIQTEKETRKAVGSDTQKFQSQTEKILSNVVKSNEIKEKRKYCLKDYKTEKKNSDEKIKSLPHKSETDETKQTIKLPSNKTNGPVHNIDSSRAKKIDTPSVLVNDDLLNELLGELDTKSETISEKNKTNKATVKLNIGLDVPQNIQMSGSLECLINPCSNGVTTKRSDQQVPTEALEDPCSLNNGEMIPTSTKKVRNTMLETHNTLPLSEKNQYVISELEHEAIRNEPTDLHLITEKSTNVTCQPINHVSETLNKIDQHPKIEIRENSNSSFLKLYGVHAPKTPEKNIGFNRNAPILNIPLTPEKTEEASTISQEVAAVLSVTKSPHVITPVKKFNADLSAISKINFEDDNEDDWNFSHIDSIE